MSTTAQTSPDALCLDRDGAQRIRGALDEATLRDLTDLHEERPNDQVRVRLGHEALTGRLRALEKPPWSSAMSRETVETAVAGTSSRLLYMVHLLDILRSAGGTLNSTVVFNELKRTGLARQCDIDTLQRSGETRFAKEVRFARLELVRASLLDCPTDGVWSLSEVGWSTFLTPNDARALVRARRHGRVTKVNSNKAPLVGPTRGPRPSNYTAFLSRDVSGVTYTYVLRFGEADIWKIGYTSDVVERLSQVNKHVPHEHLGQQWNLFAKRLWPDAPAAYTMEQQLLRALEPVRTIGERVCCSRAELVAAWRANGPQTVLQSVISS